MGVYGLVLEALRWAVWVLAACGVVLLASLFLVWRRRRRLRKYLRHE